MSHLHICLLKLMMSIDVMLIQIVTACMRLYDIWFLSVIRFHICIFIWHRRRPHPSSPLTAFTRELIFYMQGIHSQLCTVCLIVCTHYTLHTHIHIYKFMPSTVCDNKTKSIDSSINYLVTLDKVQLLVVHSSTHVHVHFVQ